MKLLNLDKVGAGIRKIRLGDKTYNVYPLSVGSFVKTTKNAEDYIKNKTNDGFTDVKQEIDLIVDLVTDCIPDISRMEVEQLSFEQLQALAAFIKGDDVDGAEDVEGND